MSEYLWSGSGFRTKYTPPGLGVGFGTKYSPSSVVSKYPWGSNAHEAQNQWPTIVRVAWWLHRCVSRLTT